MPQVREKRLIMDGSICENAYSFMDPSVQTAADARRKGTQRCPQWGPCASGQLVRDGLVCTAHLGITMARCVVKDGTTIEEELNELRASEVFDPATSNGFINPYGEEPLEPVTEDEAKTTMVEDWANLILFGPEPRDGEGFAASADPPLPDFVTLAASARTRGGGIDLAVLDSAPSYGRTNGGIPCDVSRGPCRCGAFH